MNVNQQMVQILDRLFQSEKETSLCKRVILTQRIAMDICRVNYRYPTMWLITFLIRSHCVFTVKLIRTNCYDDPSESGINPDRNSRPNRAPKTFNGTSGKGSSINHLKAVLSKTKSTEARQFSQSPVNVPHPYHL